MNTSLKYLLILTLGWIVMTALVNPVGDFPLNDDWQYAYPVKTLVKEGKLEMQGVFAPNIILQVGWGSLFCWLGGGFSFTLLRYATLVLALASVVLMYFTSRKLKLNHWQAFIGAVALATSPLFFNLSFSFMTDVPFLCAMLGSGYAFLKYLESPRFHYLLLAVLGSIAAFLIRQPGILLLPVMGGWIVWEKRSRKAGWSLFGVLLLIAGGTYFGYEKLVKPWLGISDNFVPVSRLLLEVAVNDPLNFTLELIKKGVKSWIYLGFFGLPLLPLLWHRIKPLLQQSIWQNTILMAANLLLLLYLHQIGKIFPFGGNILYNWGLGPELLADVYTLQINNTPQLPAWVMYVLNLLSQCSATLLFWVIIAAWSAYSPLQRRFFAFIILLNLAYLPAMSITSFFDRYLLLPIAAFFLLLLPLIQKPKRITTFLPLVLFSLFSLLATHDYLAWNRAKAAAFQWLRDKNIAMSEVDAGFEYNGLYNYQPQKTTEAGKSYWWVDENNWMITFGPVATYAPQSKFYYNRWLWGGRKNSLWVVKRKDQ